MNAFRGVALAASVTACAGGPPPSPEWTPLDVHERAELAALISDVTASTRHWYDVHDNLGQSMGTTDIIWVPEANAFAAAYFTYQEFDAEFHVQIATSADLNRWTWQVELGRQASQPSISAGPGGTYLVAWEQEPDPIYIVLEEFASWDKLLANEVARRFDVPITTPACGEGTPNFESVSLDRVQIGFHYHGDCVRDREAGGWTDWTTWQSALRPEVDDAIIRHGFAGHIGDRDSITYNGRELMIIEGQRVLDDWDTWRLFLYDAATQTALPLDMKTHAGSRSFGNPSVSVVDIGGRPAVLVSLFVMDNDTGEAGGAIYYRYL